MFTTQIIQHPCMAGGARRKPQSVEYLQSSTWLLYCQHYAGTAYPATVSTSAVLPVLCWYRIPSFSPYLTCAASTMPVPHTQLQRIPHLCCQYYAGTAYPATAHTSPVLPVLHFQQPTLPPLPAVCACRPVCHSSSPATSWASRRTKRKCGCKCCC